METIILSRRLRIGRRGVRFMAVSRRHCSIARSVVGMANWLQHWYRADGALSAAEIADVFASTFLYGVMRREAGAA